MSSQSARRVPLRFLARLGALAGTAVAVSVCGSQDRFNPGGGSTAPGTDAVSPVVQIILPTDTLIEIADSLKFTVNATDNTKLKSAQVTVTGLGTFALAVSKDTTFVVGTTAVTMYTQAFVVPLPTNAAGQRIAISATATDGSDNVATFTDTVRVNDTQVPVVTMLSPTASVAVGSGDTIHIVARATDPSGVRYLGARLFVRDSVLGRVQSLAVDSLVYTSRQYMRLDSFRIVVPASLPPGSYILQAFSADSSVFFNKGASPDVAVAVRDVSPPTGTFNGPALDSQVVAGDTLPVSFHAADNVGVASVRFRGYGLLRDPRLGPPDTIPRFQELTATLPTPRDTATIVRRLVPVLSASTADSVLIEAKVTDIGGNVTTVTRRIQAITGVRAVTILSPSLVDTAVSAGDSLLVQFRAQDRRGITAAIVEGLALRGDSQLGTDSLVPRFASRFVSLNAVQDTTLRRYLRADSTDLRAEPVFVRVRMLSPAGDTITAQRRIQVITGASARVASPSRDTTVAVGNPLGVTVSGYDPDSVLVVGYVSTGAIARRDSSVYVSPLGQARTAALSLPVPGTTPLTADTLTPFVIDRLGSRTVGQSVVVTFQDLTPPALTFVSPSIDTGIAYGDSVRVQVRVRDNAVGTAVSLVGRAVNAAGQTQTWFSPVSIAGVAGVDVTVARYLPALAVDPAGSQVYLIGTATDAVGNTFKDSIRVQVTSGPYVRITEPATGTQIRLGQTGARILPLVQAYSPDTILYLGYAATGRVVRTDSVATTRALTATTLAQQLALVVPDTTPLGTVTLTPFARTRSGRLTGPAVSVELIDGSLPVVRILAPTRAGTFQVPSGDSLFVRVALSDDRQLASLQLAGFARRPDVWPDSLGQVTAVPRFLPKTIDLTGTVRDTVVRFLNAAPGEFAAENAYIVATATDLAGNVAVDTVRVQVLHMVSGPVLTIVRPVAGTLTSAGKRLVVEIQANDSNGVRLVGWRTSGVVNVADSLFYSASGGVQPKSVSFIDTLHIPGAVALGTFTITPFAVDSLGDPSAVGAGITVTVQSSAADTTPPAVTFAVSRRIETTDSITVAATDPSGIGSLTWRATKLGDTLTVYGSGTTGALPGIASDVRATFGMNLAGITRYPTQVVVRATATDSGGARTGIATAETLTVVAGRTFALPAGSGIGDAIYNPNRQELYLSNTALDRIEVFDVATSTFVASIPVGSRPVGLALWPSDTTTRANADTLIVANSGGTNLSIVDLVTRVERQRYRLPNYVIQKVKAQKDPTTGFTRLTITEYDYSDRPQYVAAVCRSPGPRANCGNVIALYSTTPTPGQVGYPNRGYLAWENLTSAAVDGTKGHFFWEQAAAAITLTTDTLQVIVVRDSVPGTPVRRNILGAGVGQIVDFDLLEFQDSTFVRNSGNYLRALVGEGGTDLGFARVMAFDPTPGTVTIMPADTTPCNAAGLVCTGTQDLGISDAVFVRDFITNRASRVSSIAINQNGRTMLVRADSIYAFNQTLGQTGLMRAGSGAVGMDFHPSNDFDANVRGSGGLGGAGSPSNRLVFAARPDSSIDVFDTFFYGEVTDTTTLGATIPVPIRNSLIGPVRAATRGGNTLLFGLTAYGLVQVQLPTITNSLFPTAGLRAEAPAGAAPPRIVSSGTRSPSASGATAPRSGRDPSPPRE